MKSLMVYRYMGRKNKFTLLLKNMVEKYIAIIIFLAFLEILPSIGVVNPIFLPPISKIILSIWSTTINGTLPIAFTYTFFRVLAGLSISILIAIPLGFLLGGFFQNLEKSINPLFKIFEQFNPLTLFHLLIILISINELSTIIVIYWASQWPILNSTISAIKNVDHTLIKVAKMSKFDKFDIFWKIHIPSSIPKIFTGIRLGLLFAFLISMGVEMMGMTTGQGLGFFIMITWMNGFNTEMWAGVYVMTLLAISMNFILVKIEKYLIKANLF